jgi:hypothetical protein
LLTAAARCQDALVMCRPPPRRTTAWRLIWWSVLLATLFVPAHARAQEQGLSVDGSVLGPLAPRTSATIKVVATHPDGWRALDEVSVVVELHGASLEELSYDVDTTSLSIDQAVILTGTANEVAGRFFFLRGSDVRATTGGKQLTLTLKARVREELPAETRFRFGAIDDLQSEISVVRRAAIPEAQGGFPLPTVLAAITAALLAGALVGTEIGRHRRMRPSVYLALQRRLDAERARRPASSGRTGR